MRAWSLSIFTYSKPYTHAFYSQLYNTIPLSSKESDYRTLDYVVRSFPVSFSSGALAGMSAGALSCPFELTKLGSQIELVMKRRELLKAQANPAVTQSGLASASAPTDFKPLGNMQIAKRLVKQRGLFSLYSGFKYQIWRDIIGSGIYFGVYDSIKSGVSLAFFNSPEPHPVAVAIAGGLSGFASWIFIYPIDTYKSRYQRDVMSRVFADKVTAASSQPIPAPNIQLRHMFQTKMYRGLSISLIRTSILGTIMFSCYEQLMVLTA